MKRQSIKQVWVRYDEWEDFKNGMWRKVQKSEEQELLNLAIEFTGNWVEYGAAMKEVVYAWPRTMLNSLTNNSINQRAFIGHCACCLKFHLPEYITRMAWVKLTDKQRFEADAIAQKVIDNWKEAYKNKMQIKISFPDYD